MVTVTKNNKMNLKDSRWAETLKNHGLRPTHSRRLILALLSVQNDHPTTDGIIQALRKKGYPISPATLYQNLNKLVETGLLHRLTDAEGLNRFDANLKPHHHLICTACNRMIDVSLNEDPLLKQKPTGYESGEMLSGWNIRSVNVELTGTCPSCSAKNNTLSNP